MTRRSCCPWPTEAALAGAGATTALAVTTASWWWTAATGLLLAWLSRPGSKPS